MFQLVTVRVIHLTSLVRGAGIRDYPKMLRHQHMCMAIWPTQVGQATPKPKRRAWRYRPVQRQLLRIASRPEAQPSRSGRAPARPSHPLAPASGWCGLRPPSWACPSRRSTPDGVIERPAKPAGARYVCVPTCVPPLAASGVERQRRRRRVN